MIVGTRDGKPAVNVKDTTLWAHDPRTRDLISELAPAIVDAIYEGVREDFWRDVAPDLAREHGYSGEVFSAGRSEGWLVLGDDLDWTEYIGLDGSVSDALSDDGPGDDDALMDRSEDDTMVHAIASRDRFLAFASAVGAIVCAAGEMFVQRLTEARADLERAREDCIIRSEN